MKDLFLVKGRIRYTPYMGDTTVFDDIRLVRAGSPSEAEEIYDKWWEEKSSDYSHSYFSTCEAMETLGSTDV